MVANSVLHHLRCSGQARGGNQTDAEASNEYRGWITLYIYITSHPLTLSLSLSLCERVSFVTYNLNNDTISFRLWECKLSESSCAFLASALCSKSTSLRKLNLKNNKLRDAGVKQLYSALEHPNCKLETLE